MSIEANTVETPDLPRHPIQVVVRRTGLKPDLIRAWERRYSAVTPARAGNGRRVYSDRDVERLYLLRQAIRGGRRIGDIADSDDHTLRTLIAEDDVTRQVSPSERPGSTPPGIRQLLEQLRLLDDDGFARSLRLLGDQIPPVKLIDQIIRPLLNQIGESVRTGELRIYHEHLATVLVRQRLAAMLNELNPAEGNHRIVVTTPVGQVHGLGALMAGVVAAATGSRVLYLGVNLPAEEIAAVSIAYGASHVALSIVHPPDDTRMLGDLRRLRRLLPPEVKVFAGGRAIQANSQSFEGIGVGILDDLDEFARRLSSGS